MLFLSFKRCYFVNSKPVSYTHLDVYKRQGQYYASAAHYYPQDVIPGTHFQQAESTWGLKNAP